MAGLLTGAGVPAQTVAAWVTATQQNDTQTIVSIVKVRPAH
jgi:hypothetical protein